MTHPTGPDFAGARAVAAARAFAEAVRVAAEPAAAKMAAFTKAAQDALASLTEFLSARLDEDERYANEVDRANRMVRTSWVEAGPFDAPDSPARVLADVEAKRRIVARHSPEEFGDAPGEFFCRRCQRTAEVWPCPDVLDLAQPYRDNSDFDPSWLT